MNDGILTETYEADFSVVIPVHNEAKLLAYTLPSIYGLKPREAVFILDRCTDSTEDIIKGVWKKYDNERAKLVLLRVESKSKWRVHLNFLYDLGIRKAQSKIVLLSQADVLYDHRKIQRNIADALHGMVSFAVSSHPHLSFWNHFVDRSLQLFGAVLGLTRFSGVFAISKQHYLSCFLTTEDFLNFDTQLKMNFEKMQNAYKFVLSKNLNLRPWARSKLWNLGVDKYEVGVPFWKVMLFSIIRLMPEVFAGYLHARLSKDNAS